MDNESKPITDLIKRIDLVNPKDGDVAIVNLKGPISPESLARLRVDLEPILHPAKLVVFEGLELVDWQNPPKAGDHLG